MEGLAEAFKSLDLLEEGKFEIGDEGIKELQAMLDMPEEEVIEIADLDAETEDDMDASYIGKLVVACNICHAPQFKDVNGVVRDETDPTIVNKEEECPLCTSLEGYRIVGQITEYAPTEEIEVDTDKDGDVDVSVKVEPKAEEEVDTEEAEEKNEEELEEKFSKPVITNDMRKRRMRRQVEEDLENISIETDKETITVTSTEKEDTKEEMIAPVSDETMQEIEDNEEIEDEEKYADIDIDEFAEDEFDELGEAYLKKTYDNVASYKTVKGTVDGNSLKLEGLITFKSGKVGKTSFVFESAKLQNGKVKFYGLNEQFSRGKKSFALTGKVRGSKLTCEALAYNYRTRDMKTGKSCKVQGRVAR